MRDRGPTRNRTVDSAVAHEMRSYNAGEPGSASTTDSEPIHYSSLA